MRFWRAETFWLTVVADLAAVLAVVLPGSAHVVQAVAGAAAGVITAAYVHGASAPATPPPGAAASSAPTAVTASQVADVLSAAASSLRGGA